MTLLRRLLHWHRWGPRTYLDDCRIWCQTCATCGDKRYYTLEEDAMGAYWMRVRPWLAGKQARARLARKSKGKRT
jgi:hypothetical protein